MDERNKYWLRLDRRSLLCLQLGWGDGAGWGDFLLWGPLPGHGHGTFVVEVVQMGLDVGQLVLWLGICRSQSFLIGILGHSDGNVKRTFLNGAQRWVE